MTYRLPFPFVASMLAAMLVAGCGGSSSDEDDRSSGNRGRNETPLASVTDQTISEGSRGLRTISVPVSLSVAPSEEVRIKYETVDGTAIAGEDYQEAHGELVFSKGNRRKDISVGVIGDTKHEPDEVFEIRLVSATNAELDSKARSARITLADDDDPPAISFTTPRQVVSEKVGQTSVQLTLASESGYDVEVPLTVSGTAQKDGDYRISSGTTVSWAPGERAQTVTVEIIADTIPEGGETILLGLGTPRNGSLDADPAKLQHAIIIAGDVALNDTGVQTFANDSDYGLPVEPSSHPGQDASFGRDVTESNPNDGAAGFSFTKLDPHGNPLPATASEWACVRDNATGLVWENKQPAPAGETTGSLWRAVSYVYTWYNPDPSVNGGNDGSINAVDGRPLPKDDPRSSECAYQADTGRRHNLYCNSHTYVQDANFYGLCGFDDWRVPTAQELRSIYRYQADEEIALPDPMFFEHTASHVSYLTATPSADNDASAWSVSASGDVQLLHKGSAAAIRLVRKGE